MPIEVAVTLPFTATVTSLVLATLLMFASTPTSAPLIVPAVVMLAAPAPPA
jgi:hypothetical protein